MYPFGRAASASSGSFGQWTWRKNHVIVGIWLLGVAISLPESLMFSAEPFCYNKRLYYDCRQVWPDSISNPYTVFIYLLTFAIPLSLLTFLYTSIGLKLWRHQMPGNVDVNRDLTMQTMRVKVIKMLFVVVILFAVSWLPLQTFSMLIFLYPEIRQGVEYRSNEYNIFVGTYFACHWLSMAHSCFNPLIYCFMNDKFRSDLQALVLPGRKRQSQLQLATGSQLHHHHQNHAPKRRAHSPVDGVGESCPPPEASSVVLETAVSSELASGCQVVTGGAAEGAAQPQQPPCLRLLRPAPGPGKPRQHQTVLVVRQPPQEHLQHLHLQVQQQPPPQIEIKLVAEQEQEPASNKV